MNIDFKKHAELLFNANEDSLFWGIAKAVAGNYYSSFKLLAPWALMISITTYLINLLIPMHFLVMYLVLNIYTIGLCYIQNILIGSKSNDWIFWLILSIPYTIIPVMMYYLLNYIGGILAIMFMLSTSLYIQEAIVRKSTMFDSYYNSFFLTWKYNFRLLLMVITPFMFLIALKIYLSSLIGFSGQTWLSLVYLLSSILFLPWFAIFYGIFYEYLRIEKPNV